MSDEKEKLRQALGPAIEDERTRSILGKIDSEIDAARGQPANELSSGALRLAGIRNKADRALAIENDRRATRLEALLDTVSDSINEDNRIEVEKEIRRLRR